MAKEGGANLLERLGQDLSAAILMLLDNPADLVRSASVSHSWRRFVIENGFCKKLCLRITPEISYFVRALEVGALSKNVEIGPNFTMQWRILESEHRIYAYLGYFIISPRSLKELFLEQITISSTVNRMKNMVPNTIGPNLFSSFSSSQGNSLITFRFNSKFCVVHEIMIQPGVAIFQIGNLVYRPEIMLFRLGHVRDENADCGECLVGNYFWTYVSPEISITQTGKFQSIKLPRPVVCISGILQVELFTGVQNFPTDKLSYKSTLQMEAIGRPLAPVFDVSVLDNMGNSVLMYFPGVVGSCSRSRYSRNINAKKRRNRLYS